MSWQLASVLVLIARARRSASPGTSARARRRACSRWSPRWRRSPRSGGVAFAAFPNVKPTTDIVLFAGYALGGPCRVRGGRAGGARVERLPRPGPVDAVADGRLGHRRAARRRAAGPRCCAGASRGRCALALSAALAGLRVRRAARPLPVDARGASTRWRSYLAVSGTSLPYQHRARGRATSASRCCSGPRSCARSRATGAASRCAGSSRAVVAALVLALALAVALTCGARAPPRPRAPAARARLPALRPERRRRLRRRARPVVELAATPAGPRSAWRPPGVTRATRGSAASSRRSASRARTRAT